MGVTLPGWASTMLDTVGMPWINVDPDQVDQRAGELSATVQQLGTVAGQADDQVRDAVQHTGGDSGEALSDFWDSTGAKAVVAGLALTATAPIVMRAFAHVVRGSQVATLSQLASGMVRANAATVAGGPLARATALASTRLGVARVRQSLARGVEHTLTPAMRRHVTEPLNDVASRIGRLGNPEPQFAGGPLRMDIGRRKRSEGWQSFKDAKRHAEGGYVARTGVPKYKPIHQNTNELTGKDKSEIVKKAKKKGFGWKSYSDVDLGGAKYRVHKDGRIDDL